MELKQSNNGLLRFFAGTWIVSANKDESLFRNVNQVIDFCNRNQINIQNKDILKKEFRNKLKY